MADLPHFQVFPDHAEYRPVAEVTLPQGVELMTAAINHAREHRQSNLLLDVTSLTGFASPSLASRFYFMEEWASAARAFVRVAVVAPAAMIDPRKFGITVAANNNLTANVFTSSEEALAWLRNLP